MPVGERRSTSGNAITTTLSANITSSDTVIPIAASTGYPDGTAGPFFIKVDSETIKIISRTGLNLNVQTTPVTGRGWELTSAASHTTSSPVNLVFTSTDADEANAHHNDLGDNHVSLLNAARHDLSARHPISILPTGSPGNSAPGDTAAAGVASSLAKSDHKHGREADTLARTGTTLVHTGLALPASTITSVPWISETADTDGFIVANGANTTITIPTGKAGIYSGTINGVWTTGFTEDAFVYVGIAGNNFVGSIKSTAFAGYAWSFSFAGLPLTAGQTIAVSLLQFNASSRTTSATLNLYRVAA